MQKRCRDKSVHPSQLRGPLSNWGDHSLRTLAAATFSFTSSSQKRDRNKSIQRELLVDDFGSY